ncbi:hypothetical protein PAXRUDRAFT_212828 [Paxillus rubicundulus Ve08.2h10]|uniref:Nucleoporin Pom152 n=1 Tax=Paxillus rubicundulus Ve08.2h10 TaxID=930991 RepID=A0A0D0DTZ6_9AGAM|nr:hypothetical protein PAXRUDRAFT_212828 [Paxillus rubicundulus Ve08.2h10]
MATEKPPLAGARPLIPERLIDIPSQRLYYLSLGFLLQAVKAIDVLRNLFTSDAPNYYGRKWFLIDFSYVAILSQLRIPRLRYSKAIVLLQILSLWFIDGLLFGGIHLNLGAQIPSSTGYQGLQKRPDLPATPEPFRLADLFAPSGLLSFFSESTRGDQHLLGQHTVRMSPISTAHLNPDAQAFCLSPPSHAVLIPILVNNTTPANVRYSLTPLTYVEGQSGTGRVEHIELSAKDLKAIELARLEGLQSVRAYNRDSNYDEYDDDEDQTPSSDPHLQKTQSLTHIRVNKPGTIRLERVLDSSSVAARLVHPLEVTVVPCPTAHYTDDSLSKPESAVRCAGDNSNVDLTIDIRGVPPLSLRWSKYINEKREGFLVEGIEDSSPANRPHPDSRDVARSPSRIPQILRVPLSLSVDSLGRVTFVLESVIDGMGNIVSLDQSVPGGESHHSVATPNSKTRRSLDVLRRSSISFRNCDPGNPVPLLIGSEASLSLYVTDSDPLDAPWDVDINFEPSDGVISRGKPPKSWKNTLQTPEQTLSLNASAAGEYTISGIRGKWCEGDVLSPETCKVVEKPMPTAEIEWKRIHECSGDTGVSASLILHGTPPFQVYYSTQRDKENPRDLVKTFTSSRGELTLQPEHSGHYFYTFLQLSDANYRKVDLNGPSIDQVVHPLAAADFVSAVGRTKRVVNSCSGNMVDIEVDLRGTAPWNLELQIVGLRNTDSLEIRDIKTSPARIQAPIPAQIDKEGGSFEVNLDMYGCKRSISVPGISVNVRRVKPTAKFYSKNGIRQVTILENEEADLPLRLTGDGPWTVKYRRAEDPESVKTEHMKSPNDQIHVRNRGMYELLEVSDSQCPGSIATEENNYYVDWVARPSAQLDPQTPSMFITYNRSHILPPICEGHDDHVDLDLTGRPPFQIMYNIARNDESGVGTIVLDQPTFSSIQPRTRFQLHTSIAGRKYYEVKQIGDAAYPLHKHKNAVIPRSERLVFEQEVFPRPSAKFKSDNRMSFCLNDVLTPRDLTSSDGTILLEGTPPFQLQLSIRNLAASKVRKETVEVHDRVWKLDWPSYYFTSIGPYQVTIDSVHDSSHCEQAEFDPLRRSIWIDVAETAAIIPFDKKKDFCVGDVTQFQLEGTPPWSIGYRINGKSYMQDAKTSPWSIVQQQSGEFTVTSVAHQQKMCKAAITNLHVNIHPLPSAQVGHGKRIYQDIHEGDQAEIVFTLIGEPPFTFTYQRAEPSPKKGGKPGKVLETHTVSGVTTHEYSVFSALEGTWTVTSISDRHCRYPSRQEGLEKPRH